MKKLLLLLLVATAVAQPATPINNGSFTGASHIRSGASLIADPGSIIIGLPGTGSVTGVDFSGGSSGLVVTGGPITSSGTLTISGGVLTKAFGGNGTATPALTQGTGITITGTWPNYTIAAVNPGTVTSVALTAPDIFNVTGTPITSTGTLTIAFATQSANLVLAGPASGSAEIPMFRALVAADIPDISGVYQPLNTANLSAIAALTTTAYGRSVLTQANAAALRTLAGLGTLATQNGTFSGTSSGTNTGDQTTISGNAGTSTALQTARTINGVLFNGTANITVAAAAGTLTGSTLAAGVTASSLQSAAGGSFGTAAYTNSTAYEVPLIFSTGLNRATNTITVVTDAGLPAQTGNSGKFLTTDGSTSSWATSSGSGDVTHTGTLTASAIIVGNGTSDIKVLASLGTTTTLLHGNAAGLPTFGAVSLTADVSGALPIANGGTSGTTKAGAFDALSPMSASGDIIYGSTSGTGTRLAKGTDGQVMTLASGIPSWATITGTGTVTTSGSPSSGQAAEFTGSTVITGVAITGTGSYVKGTSPTFTTGLTTPKIIFTTSVTETFGTGSPESAVTANIGSVFHRTDGGSGTSLYVKESGTGNTGWTGLGAGGGGSPGGSNTQLQYNNSSAFGGISGATSNGTAVTFTAGNLIATSPKITTGINDTNGNELFVLTATSSAVNEITFANAATGTNPAFTASGGDADVGITISPKGAGIIGINSTSTSVPLQFIVAANYNDASGNGLIELGRSGGSNQFFTGTVAGDCVIKVFSDDASKKLFIGASNTSSASLKISPSAQAEFLAATDSSSSTTGGSIFDGGVGIAKKLFVGDSITTDAPSGGTAGAWKLGAVVTGVTSTFVTTNYIEVDVGGSLFKLATVTSVP